MLLVKCSHCKEDTPVANVWLEHGMRHMKCERCGAELAEAQSGDGAWQLVKLPSS